MQDTAAATEPKALDPLHLMLNASGPVLAVLLILFFVAATFGLLGLLYLER